MKNLIILAFTPLFMLFAQTSFSQSQLKIGHVNFDELIQALPEKDSAQAILDKESKELKSAYDELTVAYNKLYDDYQNGLPTFSPAIKKMKEDELADKQKRMAEFEQNATLTLQKRNNELLQPMINKINKAIEKVGNDNSFTYILDTSKGSVAFVSKESQNLNPLVLKILKPSK
jgi:outer membrane protein